MRTNDFSSIGLVTSSPRGTVSEQKLRPGIFVASDHTKLPYHLYIPNIDYADAALPVLLFLHGAGERGSGNDLPFRTDLGLLNQLMSNPQHYPCVILLPQCAQDSQWVDTPWAEGNYSLDDIPMSRYLTAVKELLIALEEVCSIDPSRRYITGLSMGGFGTWDMIMRYPRAFAAALPICGGADPSKASRLCNLPIRTYHGSADPAVPVEGTRAMAQAMKACGACNFFYTEMEGAGHEIWREIYRNPETAEWLFAHRREDVMLRWDDAD